MSSEIDEQPQPSQPSDISISVNDLATLHSILEVACSRAAFKPSELETVGSIYNKLTAFLNQIKETQDD